MRGERESESKSGAFVFLSTFFERPSVASRLKEGLREPLSTLQLGVIAALLHHRSPPSPRLPLPSPPRCTSATPDWTRLNTWSPLTSSSHLI